LHDTHNTQATVPVGEVRYNKGTDRSLSVYGYEHKTSKKQVFTLWIDEYIPTDSNKTKDINFTVLNGHFEQPVYVDILTGGIYEIPENQIIRKGNVILFRNIPVYDSPVLIAEKSLLKY